MSNETGVKITLTQIYEKLVNMENAHNETMSQLKVQANDHKDLDRRVSRLEKHEWWLMTTVVGAVIVGIIGAFFAFAQIGMGG